MSGPPDGHWSNNPNAPGIPYRTHLSETTGFSSLSICAVLYGIIIMLFFRSMCSLLNPARQGGFKWPFVIHTTAMFSLTTIYSAVNFYQGSLLYIDNRQFPGFDVLPPGPVGYGRLTSTNAMTLVAAVPWILNGFLADGLLLYRCHVIYSMNYRAIAVPFLIYLSSFGTGFLYLFQIAQPYNSFWAKTSTFSFSVVSLAISVLLNVLLTLMIVARLTLHRRVIRDAVGRTEAASTGVYKVIATIVVESCAISTIGSILCLGPWSTSNYLTNSFYPILNATQVIAPFLIILRVANRTALRSDFTTGVDSIRFRSQEESSEGNGTPFDGDSLSSMNGDGEVYELGVRTEDTTKEVSS